MKKLTDSQALKERRRNPALFPERWPLGVDRDREPPRLVDYTSDEMALFGWLHWRLQAERRGWTSQFDSYHRNDERRVS